MPIHDMFSKNIARPINGVVKAEQQDDEMDSEYGGHDFFDAVMIRHRFSQI